jgi:23S rRNA (cytosine1962-C5)-methyltransferase
VAAAAGGAVAVTHVDGKRNALERARANHDLNDLPVDDRSLVRGNIYTHLPRAIRHGQRFDAVILDPPPKPPRIKGHKPRGQDYSRLARFATEILDEGGWLLCFFSRYDQSRQEYEAEVTAAGAGKLQPWWRGSSGDDFPEKIPEKKLRLTVWIKR